MSILQSLTQEQYMASTSRSPSILVLAGAGTGKTRTLMGRIEFLMHELRVPASQILLLAFANKAAQEMQGRLIELLGADSTEIPQVHTFHSLGLSITKRVQLQDLSISALHEDKRFAFFIREQFLSACRQEQYREALYKFLSLGFHEVNNNPVKTTTYRSFRSLNDDYVRNQTELICANLLFEFNIFYKWRAHYECNVMVARYLPYRCCFFLPQQQLYIEVFEQNKEQVLSSKKDRKYLQFIEQTHYKHGTKVLLIFAQDTIEHTYQSLRALFLPWRKKRKKIKIARTAMSYESLIDLLRQIITLSRNHSEPIHQVLVAHKYGDLVERLIAPISQAYKAHLQQHRQIDFSQMIHLATRHVKNGQFKVPWHHIMIDEFQDLSADRAGLIQAIYGRVPKCNLFCVGDDWQSIYHFAGSDLHYTVRFEDYFGNVQRYQLTQTYRFDSAMCQQSCRFILANPLQSRKHLVGREGRERPITVLTDDIELSEIMSEIEAENKLSGNAVATVFILSRFKHLLPAAEQLKKLQQQFPELRQSAHTVHAVKGNEADYVIVLGMNQGQYGFPSEKNSPLLVKAFLPKDDTYSYAQERRLFYVALTRARKQVYLLYNKQYPSPFIHEILSQRYDIRKSLIYNQFASKRGLLYKFADWFR